MASEPLRIELEEIDVATLRDGLAAGRWTARQLVEAYVARIDALDRGENGLRSVLEVNPDALALADASDRERADGRVRGPLHGIPVLLKDNVDTADGMLTTAGSLALVGLKATADSGVARVLREAGMVILGKTNLSEWANIRSFQSTSGWSGRGGQTLNPYQLDRNPSGSSSGSAAAVAAGYVPVTIGTETNGSIVSPAGHCGVVGIKPTVGLVSRYGVIPISHSQDTAGPMARTVADAAALLNILAVQDGVQLVGQPIGVRVPRELRVDRRLPVEELPGQRDDLRIVVPEYHRPVPAREIQYRKFRAIGSPGEQRVTR